MAFTIKQMAMLVWVFGILSFILGVIAETKKPHFGTPVISTDGVTCKFSYDPIIISSVVFLVASIVAGCLSIFYPYKEKSIPPQSLFKRNGLWNVSCFILALVLAGGGANLFLWPTVKEQTYLSHDVHFELNYACPAAKPRYLIGLGAFCSIVSSFFWSIIILARKNFPEENGVDFAI